MWGCQNISGKCINNENEKYISQGRLVRDSCNKPRGAELVSREVLVWLEAWTSWEEVGVAQGSPSWVAGGVATPLSSGELLLGGGGGRAGAVFIARCGPTDEQKTKMLLISRIESFFFLECKSEIEIDYR